MGRTILREHRQVIEEKDDKANASSEVEGKKPESVQADSKTDNEAPSEKQIQPEIAAYFSDPKISPSAFIKAVKSEKVKGFKFGSLGWVEGV